MQTSEMQELLLAIMPHWHCRIAKPFRQLFENGMSPEMYYCIQYLHHHGGATMTTLARAVHSPKQQMTKVVGMLIDKGYARRVSDPNDRRIVRLELTQEGHAYIDSFLQSETVYYQNMINALQEEDREAFGQALQTVYRILSSMSESKVTNSTERKEKAIC